MREHLLLCGLSDAQRKAFKGGRELHLKGPKKNVHQHIESMRKRLVGIEPKRLTDLLDIASYVFAADRTTSRGSAIFANMREVGGAEFAAGAGPPNLEAAASVWLKTEAGKTAVRALGREKAVEHFLDRQMKVQADA